MGYAQNIQEKIINGKFQQISLEQFFKTIEKEYGVLFYYQPEWIPNIVINQDFKQKPLIQVLNLLLDRQPIAYQFFQNNSVVLYPKSGDGRLVAGTDESQVVVIGELLNEGRYTSAVIKGKILDGKINRPLAGATVLQPQTGNGTTTNRFGDYELELPTGSQTLQVSFIGFEVLNQKIKLIETGNIDFELFDETHMLDEVTISGGAAKASKAQMSMIKLNSKALKELPIMLGEKDIIRSVIMMPGVQSVGEMSSGFNVRGGNTDQNLVLMDGAPAFNTSHLFGFFSIINPDAVQDVTFFKGGIPASYGERVSSIMDIKLKDGNTENIGINGGIGTITSRLTIDGPFAKKKKSTFLIGGRSTYSDWMLKQSRNIQLMNSVAHFYDLNGSVNLVLDNKNTVKLMGYYSKDVFNLNSNSLFTYGNIISSMNWKSNISRNLISNLNLAFSKYDFQLDQKDANLREDDYRLKTGIEYGSMKIILSWFPNDKHRVNGGIQTIGNIIFPGEILPLNKPSNIATEKVAREQSVELAPFIDDDFDLSASTSVYLGLRYSRYMYLGPTTVLNYKPDQTFSQGSVIDSTVYKSGEVAHIYQGLEPRFSIKFNLRNNGSVRFGYQRIHQYLNQVSNTSVISPADFWKSSDVHVPPLISDHFSVGLFKTLHKGLFETSVEIYFKRLQNLMEYKNGAVLVMNRHIENDIINANGYSYGLELFLKKISGKLNGWISYTYSRTMRKTDNRFPEDVINSRNYYPSVYDKPHDLSTVLNYQFSRRWRFSGNFVLSSGRPVTLAEQKYMYLDRQVVYYSDRNKYRMPPYHRMDVSITYDENLRKKRSWKGSWTFSVYNLYGRENAYSVFYRKDPSVQLADKIPNSMYQLSIIGVPVPTLTYNFRF